MFHTERFGQTALQLLSSLDTPRSLAVWLLFREGEHLQLVNLNLPSPERYATHDAFFADYQATVLVRKAKFLKTGVDLKAAALQKSKDSEALCAVTNESFTARANNPSDLLYHLLPGVRDRIARVLGDFPHEQLLSECGWGPGATASLPRRRASVVDKTLEGRLSVTSSCYRLAQIALGRDILWARARGIPADGPFSPLSGEFEIVEGNKQVFVPKDARADRSIAIEPTMNLFLQKGIGSLVRRRLKRAGIDLNDQSVNKELAREGSRSGDFATLDLSSASDTLARRVVEAVMPEDWLYYMNQMRCAWTTCDESRRFNQQYSSMGNGFTFEIESLIFYAVASAVSSFTSVYGDDIIVDTMSARQVMSALESFGFKINSEKSFISTPFRESCGGHYFAGHSVKPIYVKENPFEDEVSFFTFANGLLYRSRRGRHGFAVAVAFGKSWRSATRDYSWNALSVTDGRNTRGTGVALPIDHAKLRVHRAATLLRGDGWFGIKIPCVSFGSKRILSREQDALYAVSLRFPSPEPLSLGVPVKDSMNRPRLRGRMHWYDESDTTGNYLAFAG